jgi:hypothetical protein
MREPPPALRASKIKAEVTSPGRGQLQKLQKARRHSPLEPPERNAALPPSFLCPPPHCSLKVAPKVCVGNLIPSVSGGRPNGSVSVGNEFMHIFCGVFLFV